MEWSSTRATTTLQTMRKPYSFYRRTPSYSICSFHQLQIFEYEKLDQDQIQDLESCLVASSRLSSGFIRSLVSQGMTTQ